MFHSHYEEIHSMKQGKFVSSFTSAEKQDKEFQNFEKLLLLNLEKQNDSIKCINSLIKEHQPLLKKQQNLKDLFMCKYEDQRLQRKVNIIMITVMQSGWAQVKELLKIDPTQYLAVDSQDENLLFYALKNVNSNNCYEIFLHILNYSQQDKIQLLKDRKRNGNSILMMAVQKCNLPIVKLLVQNQGAEVNDQNQAGDTALHIAVRKYGTEKSEQLLNIIRIIYYNQADCQIENNEGVKVSVMIIKAGIKLQRMELNSQQKQIDRICQELVNQIFQKVFKQLYGSSQLNQKRQEIVSYQKNDETAAYMDIPKDNIYKSKKRHSKVNQKYNKFDSIINESGSLVEISQLRENYKMKSGEVNILDEIQKFSKLTQKLTLQLTKQSRKSKINTEKKLQILEQSLVSMNDIMLKLYQQCFQQQNHSESKQEKSVDIQSNIIETNGQNQKIKIETIDCESIENKKTEKIQLNSKNDIVQINADQLVEDQVVSKNKVDQTDNQVVDDKVASENKVDQTDDQVVDDKVASENKVDQTDDQLLDHQQGNSQNSNKIVKALKEESYNLQQKVPYDFVVNYTPDQHVVQKLPLPTFCGQFLVESRTLTENYIRYLTNSNYAAFHLRQFVDYLKQLTQPQGFVVLFTGDFSKKLWTLNNLIEIVIQPDYSSGLLKLDTQYSTKYEISYLITQFIQKNNLNSTWIEVRTQQDSLICLQIPVSQGTDSFAYKVTLKLSKYTPQLGKQSFGALHTLRNQQFTHQSLNFLYTILAFNCTYWNIDNQMMSPSALLLLFKQVNIESKLVSFKHIGEYLWHFCSIYLTIENKTDEDSQKLILSSVPARSNIKSQYESYFQKGKTVAFFYCLKCIKYSLFSSSPNQNFVARTQQILKNVNQIIQQQINFEQSDNCSQDNFGNSDNLDSQKSESSRPLKYKQKTPQKKEETQNTDAPNLNANENSQSTPQKSDQKQSINSGSFKKKNRYRFYSSDTNSFFNENQESTNGYSQYNNGYSNRNNGGHNMYRNNGYYRRQNGYNRYKCYNGYNNEYSNGQRNNSQYEEADQNRQLKYKQKQPVQEFPTIEEIQRKQAKKNNLNENNSLKKYKKKGKQYITEENLEVSEIKPEKLKNLTYQNNEVQYESLLDKLSQSIQHILPQTYQKKEVNQQKNEQVQKKKQSEKQSNNQETKNKTKGNNNNKKKKYRRRG